jgi:hypothetical protein
MLPSVTTSASFTLLMTTISSVFLVGASHTLQHEAEDEQSMQNANAYPAYQYPN